MKPVGERMGCRDNDTLWKMGDGPLKVYMVSWDKGTLCLEWSNCSSLIITGTCATVSGRLSYVHSSHQQNEVFGHSPHSCNEGVSETPDLDIAGPYTSCFDLSA